MRLFPCLLLLAGCGRLESAGSLADPVILQGLYLGIEDNRLLDELSNDEDDGAFAYRAACKVFLVNFSDPSSIGDAPVEGADVRFKSHSSGDLEFREDAGGKYMLDATDRLDYVVGEKATVSVDVEGDNSEVLGDSPVSPPEIEIPTAVPARSSFEVHLPKGKYQNMVVAVFDAVNQELTWQNLPTEFADLYAYTRPENPVDTVLVPEEAVPHEGYYLVGIAGMEIADVSGFEGVNTTLSAFMAGQLAVRALTVTE